MNIVIIHRTGGDFRISDVYLLVTHINKYWGNSKERPNIYCYTNTVTKETKVVGLAFRPLPNSEWEGWWSKMNLFSEELKALRPFLYMDIDTVVLSSIAPLFPPKEAEHNFVTLRDFYRPNNLASGLMWIPDTPAMDEIYKKWAEDVEGNMRRFKGDQNFIEYVVLKPDRFWQDISKADFITTFKPNKVWRTEMPKSSAVVCFHGIPRIPQAALSVEWVKSYVNYEI